jgi:anti-sigma factor (TIGR02949 family)
MSERDDSRDSRAEVSTPLAGLPEPECCEDPDRDMSGDMASDSELDDRVSECAMALSKLQMFLHHELSATDADVFRAHLDACEKCFDEFGVEETISGLIRRCQPQPKASSSLRLRVVSVSMTMRSSGNRPRP